MKSDKHIEDLYHRIASLLQAAKQSVTQTINHAMVTTYYEIGKMIVEDQQHGHHRAAYGKHLIKNLAQRLQQEFGKGFSEDNLDRMKKFYVLYAPRISATPLRKLPSEENEPAPQFLLSWSHYLKLMRIDDPAERRFYREGASNPSLQTWNRSPAQQRCASFSFFAQNT